MIRVFFNLMPFYDAEPSINYELFKGKTKHYQIIFKSFRSMKTLFSYTFSLIFLGCNNPQTISYQEAIDKCKLSSGSVIDPNTNTPIYVSADPSFLIGVHLPLFNATTISGKVIDENYFKGKVTIINFWFIGCQPCIAEIPGFNEIVKKIGKDKINYLAIGKDNPTDINEFLVAHPWDFDIVPLGNELIYKVFQFQWGYPFTFLVDEDSKIVKVISGGSDDEKAQKEIQEKLIPEIQELL